MKIKKIGRGGKFTQDEERMKKNIQNSLASRLQELSLKFKRNQREYLTTLRGSELGGDSDDPFALDISQVQTTLSHALVDDVSFSHNMAMQREEELRNLLKSIEELNSIFKDISILVIEQGTILDRIDYNIERADHNLTQAAENLDIVRSRSCFELFLLTISLTGPYERQIIKNETMHALLGHLRSGPRSCGRCENHSRDLEHNNEPFMPFPPFGSVSDSGTFRHSRSVIACRLEAAHWRFPEG
jgi:hypothetical protein